MAKAKTTTPMIPQTSPTVFPVLNSRRSIMVISDRVTRSCSPTNCCPVASCTVSSRTRPSLVVRRTSSPGLTWAMIACGSAGTNGFSVVQPVARLKQRKSDTNRQIIRFRERLLVNIRSPPRMCLLFMNLLNGEEDHLPAFSGRCIFLVGKLFRTKVQNLLV